MVTRTSLAGLAGLMLCTSVAMAQGAGGSGEGFPAEGPVGAAGRAGGGTFNEANTPGWASMSADERSAHQRRMQSFRSYDECRGYMNQFTERMHSRSGTAGPGGASPAASGDPCGHLPRS